VNPEAENPRGIFFRRLGHDTFVVRQQEQVAEGGAKVGAVEVGVLRAARVVGLVAAGAEHFHREFAGNIRETDGQDGLALAQGPRAPAKAHVLELLILFEKMQQAGSALERGHNTAAICDRQYSAHKAIVHHATRLTILFIPAVVRIYRAWIRP
jgi:hypothetical protein